MTHTHCSIDHVLRAWPFAPVHEYRPWRYVDAVGGLARDASEQRRTRLACTGFGGKSSVALRLIVPLLELPTCPRCQVLWDLAEELRQEVTP